jgi:DNA polymerase-3 subunit gamma/tau
MAFQSLYRRHRPQRFGDLVGQEHVMTALRNAVREGRIGHAYLFSGPRGTGKTTTARLLAKAVNCANLGADGEPCNECSSCIEIAAATSLDVVELDAASNRGVNEMRALLERVVFRAAGGGSKVYIVDEVHMLTKEASSALLKTLEEPPEHVIFVLATTDPQMVFPTIRSRTQHFEFGLLPPDRLVELVTGVLEREGIAVDAEAVAAIARRAAGSGRDALSLLDQVLAYNDGALDASALGALFGGTTVDRVAAVVDAIAAEDPAGALEAVGVAAEHGTDPRQLADDLLRHLRDVFLLVESRGRVHVDAPDDELKVLLAHGEALPRAVLVRALENLGETAIEVRRAADPRLTLEVALVRLARRDAGSSIDALVDRVARLEHQIEELGKRPAPAPAAPAGAGDGPRAKSALGAHAPATPAKPPRPARAAPPDPPAAEAAVPAEPLDLDDVVLAWPDALKALTTRMRAMAGEAQVVAVEGASVVLALPTQFANIHKAEIEKNAAVISDALGKHLGKVVRGVIVRLDDAFVSRHTPLPDRAQRADDAADDDIDPTELVDAPASDPGVDSVGRLIEHFDATVEGEIPREK